MAHVLLIEDDPDVTRLLKSALAKYGHSVTCSGDGAAGLAQLKRSNPAPEIVVTDILMPVQEGIETIMAIRRVNSAIPIVAISGGGRTKRLDFLRTAEKLGANAALAKPFRPADLARTIEKLLAVKASPAAGRGS
ncbi:response regulator [Parvibaculum sp.]|uniref:response regulator n=1 Tax=Parvibaculum sp. TaxID=2024848 RepID=UPI0034A08B58